MIRPDSTLREIAFIVCTQLDAAGLTAVLTGGSAVTVWAPNNYESRDLDFVVEFYTEGKKAIAALEKIGYYEDGRVFASEANMLTVDLLPGPLGVGGDLLTEWTTLRENGLLLHVTTPTDSVRDRLAAYIHWRDLASLDQAVSVARAQREIIEFETVKEWCAREGRPTAFDDLMRGLSG